MICIEKVSKAINQKTIFNNISLHCRKNEIYVLVGPNGIGKTSLLKSILGLYSIDSGTISVLGETIGNSIKTNPNTGIFFETAKMLPHSKVRESLSFFASLYNKTINDITSLINCLHLEEQLDKTFISLSSGNKRKLGLLISLINNPDLLIWDEPFAALDPEMCRELSAFMVKLKDEGKTILFTTNDLFYADNLYDRIGFFISSDRIIEKAKEEILSQYPGKSLNDVYFLVKEESL